VSSVWGGPFVKQMGAPWARQVAKDPSGANPEEWPEDLRIREFPKVWGSDQPFRPGSGLKPV